MFIKEIYLSNKARSTTRHTFTKERKLPDKRGRQGPLGPPLIPLLLCSYPAFIPFGLIIDRWQTPAPGLTDLN